jgi:hypothetical protein
MHGGYSWPAGGDTFSGIGLVRACMVDIHAPWIFMDRWGYILWYRLGPSMHGGYPCTVDIPGHVGIHYTNTIIIL